MDSRVQQQVSEVAQALGSNTAEWKDLLAVWCKVIGADFATFQVWDKVEGQLLGHVTAGLCQPALQQAYIDHFQAIDPLLPIGLQRKAGAWVDSAVDLSERAWRSGAYYAELLRPLRVEQTIALCLCNDARYIASMSLHRSKEADAAVCKQTLAPLCPVVVDAFEQRMQQTNAEYGKLDAVLSSEHEGWLLIAPELQVRHASATAAQFLVEAQVLQLHGGCLQARHAAVAQRLQRAAQAVRRGQPPQTLHFSAGWGRVLQLRLRLAPRHLAAFGEALLLVRVKLRDAKTLPDVTTLREVYALTQAQARLVRELAAGHTLNDCALLFSVSRNTLRNQMADIFVKMGCSRQADVVRLAGLLT